MKTKTMKLFKCRDVCIYSRTVKGFVRVARESYGMRGEVSRVFIDGPKGEVYHTGYCIGTAWFRVYEPLMVPA